VQGDPAHAARLLGDLQWRYGGAAFVLQLEDTGTQWPCLLSLRARYLQPGAGQ
jgi:hypothetical protein